MKHLNKLLILNALFLSIIACSQPTGPDKDLVATTVNELYKAMVEKNKGKLETLTAENLTYGHSSGLIEDKATYVAAIMTGPFEFISINPDNQSIAISGDTAVVRHIFNAKGKNKGEPVDVHIGILMVFQKWQGTWKLIVRQAYKL